MNELLTTCTPETKNIESAVTVFISGLPGKMATLVAEQLSQNGQFDLLPIAMSSAKHRRTTQFIGECRVNLIDYCPSNLEKGTVAVDFTTPQSATLNAIHYTELGVPFVMGTTGGDREEIENMIRGSQISAVIAPNMAIEVVELQDDLQNLIETDPNIFQGWSVTIRESHQAAKRDVSGTARALQAQLERLGATMDGEIESIRDPEIQRQFGVQNLDGHAYHWITLTGSNGQTREFRTAIEGRRPYVEGTLAAIKFLSRQIVNGSKGEIFGMRDVVNDLRRQA